MTWVKKNEVCHEGRPHDQQNLIHESSVLCELLLIEFQERHFRVVNRLLANSYLESV